MQLRAVTPGLKRTQQSSRESHKASEPRNAKTRRSRDIPRCRRQHVRHRHARGRRSAEVEDLFMLEQIASEAERSHDRPLARKHRSAWVRPTRSKPMMHGREKSDPAIVAARPANEVGEEPAEELAEPRAGAEGKTGQPDTTRAQNRIGVAQGLDRIRKAAKNKETRFTSLLHHVSVALLDEAFWLLLCVVVAGFVGLFWR